MAFAAGTQIGQYRLKRRLGAGGMGEVYLAQDTRLDREVAIKFLAAPSDEQSRRRLLREARAVAALEHPNICAVYDVGTDPNCGDFIAMQYVEGDTLASRVHHGRLRPEESLSAASQIAEALMAAHKRGIVHRDLKPQNIVITPSGVLKLLDFGLATYVPNAAGAAKAATVSRVTRAHAVVGTPGYMAPEQIRGEPVDFRSDVFSLGCVLYECLTGRAAFEGATSAETHGNVLHVDPPPVSSLVPEVGPVYDALCERLLHKVPGERFQSAEEVLGAIRALTPPSSRHPVSSAVLASAPRSNTARRVAIVAVVAAVSLATYVFWPRGPVLRPAPPEAVRLYEMGVAFMQDGTYVAARTAFNEAIRAFPQYAQAYSRLAEAHIALDDERSANEALLQVAKLVPNRSRLPPEEALRFDAASAAALRQRTAAIDAYQKLVNLKPDDVGRWLDLGRALETGAQLKNAANAYAKAASLDRLSPAAHLRLGVILARTGQTKEALASIDKALEQYRNLGKAEGEAEALLRKGVALSTVGRPDEARKQFDQVIGLAVESRYPAQRLGAQLGLAKLDHESGHADRTESLANQAVADAMAAGLPTLAANGRVDIGNFLLARSLHKQADAQYTDALRLATERGATRLENRAKLSQASLRIQENKPDDALALATGPAGYFEQAGEMRLAIDAVLIQSRAKEAREEFAQALELADRAHKYALQADDNVRLSYALENKAGQATKLGRLPEALAFREQLVDLNQKLKNARAVSLDLTNQAELLIRLGRMDDARAVIRGLDQQIAAGQEVYVARRERVAQLKLLLAVTTQQWEAATRDAASVLAMGRGSPADQSSVQQEARILSELALAHRGRSRESPAVVAGWPAAAEVPGDRREWSVWAAQTLLLRGENALAVQLVSGPLSEAVVKENHELFWRLAAVSAEAHRRMKAQDGAASVAAQAKSSVEQIKAAWAGAATLYLARPDLAALMKAVQ